MTEYIIIVGLIAIFLIVAVRNYGEVIETAIVGTEGKVKNSRIGETPREGFRFDANGAEVPVEPVDLGPPDGTAPPPVAPPDGSAPPPVAPPAAPVTPPGVEPGN
jgi:hypothetical protein